MKFFARIPGYGTFEIDADSRDMAEDRAEDKRRWERAPSKLVWRADLSTEYDRLAARIAAIFDDGRGVDVKLMRKMSKARKSLAETDQINDPL